MSDCSSPYGALTSTSPGFIQSYFSKSRLHHISTWKSDLSEYVCQYYIQKAAKAKCNKAKMSSPNEVFRTIMHVDLDCFFASVALLDRPHLKGKPVAVAHSCGPGNYTDASKFQSNSSSEIASCNYEARAKGVRNGMFLGTAKSLSPDLVVVPYEFEKYDNCSKSLYRILMENADYVQAVSCDEAYVDITFQIQHALSHEILSEEGKQFKIEEISRKIAESIRAEIFSASGGCTASVGISSNILLARLATKKAKPNGVFYIPHAAAGEHMRYLPIADLPGVGHAIVKRCADVNLFTCGDILQSISIISTPGCSGMNNSRFNTVNSSDKYGFGEKTWAMLCGYAAGKDDRVLENKGRQTVGAEINWGMRFQTESQIEAFMREFSEEVYNRLKKAGLSSSHITVTVKKKLYEGEPGKFLGCGHCEDFSKSSTLASTIDTSAVLFQNAYSLFRRIGVKPLDVRGIGIHLRKLGGTHSGNNNSNLHSAISIRSKKPNYDDGSTNGTSQLVALVDAEEDDLEPEKHGGPSDWSSAPSNPLRQSVLKFRSQSYSNATNGTLEVSPSKPQEKLESLLQSPCEIPIRNNNDNSKFEREIPSNSAIECKKRKISITSYFGPVKNGLHHKEEDNKTSTTNQSSSRDSCYTDKAVVEVVERVNTNTYHAIRNDEELDRDVLMALPPDIIAELRNAGVLNDNHHEGQGVPKADKAQLQCENLDFEVDEEFLAALPEELRAEQLQWIHRQRKINSKRN